MNSSDNYTTFDSSIFLHKNSNIEFESSNYTHPAAIKVHYPIYTTKWTPFGFVRKYAQNSTMCYGINQRDNSIVYCYNNDPTAWYVSNLKLTSGLLAMCYDKDHDQFVVVGKEHNFYTFSSFRGFKTIDTTNVFTNNTSFWAIHYYNGYYFFASQWNIFYTSDHTFASGNTVAIPNITVGKNIVHINHTDNYVFATADEGNLIYAYNTDYSKWYTIHPSDFCIRESIIIGDYVYCVADGISIIRLSVTDPNDNKVFSLAGADPLQQCWDLIYCEPYFVLTGHESGKLFVVKLNDNDLSLVDEMVLSQGQVLNIIRFNDMFLITTDEKYIHIFQKSNKLSISDNNVVVNNSFQSDHIETQSINAPPYNDKSVLHVNNFVALEITANEHR